MSLESTLPKLEQVEHHIGQRLRELRVLRSLRRILKRKQREDESAEQHKRVAAERGEAGEYAGRCDVDHLRHYREVWMVDFEFSAPDGERPTPVCLVARELFSNRLIRLFAHELRDRPPFPTDENTLFVAFFASAEMGCFLALSWDLPRRILDLWTEQRVRTNDCRRRTTD